MKWKLNAAELLILNSARATEASHIAVMTPALLLLWLLSHFPDCWKMQCTNVQAANTHGRTHFNHYCPLPLGVDSDGAF